MMYLDAPPRLVGAEVFSAMPDACTNVAIGGTNRDRLYVTESATGTVLVADIGD